MNTASTEYVFNPELERIVIRMEHDETDNKNHYTIDLNPTSEIKDAGELDAYLEMIVNKLSDEISRVGSHQFEIKLQGTEKKVKKFVELSDALSSKAQEDYENIVGGKKVLSATLGITMGVAGAVGAGYLACLGAEYISEHMQNIPVGLIWVRGAIEFFMPFGGTILGGAVAGSAGYVIPDKIIDKAEFCKDQEKYQENLERLSSKLRFSYEKSYLPSLQKIEKPQ
ncbi:hypothetical protein H6503_03170 [Candidatus Woesearchaeota archaeon]|nr:hypothetical protein [Candidatus Woesearchaeota archaeon]